MANEELTVKDVLKALKGLKWLRIAGTRVTDTGVRELRKFVPQSQPIR